MTRVRKNMLLTAFVMLASVQTAMAQTAATAARPAPARAAPQRHFDINEFRVDGNTVLTEVEIDRAVYGFLGPDKTAADVEKARATLEAAYQAKGYPTVSAEVPQQRVADGVVVRIGPPFAAGEGRPAPRRPPSAAYARARVEPENAVYFESFYGRAACDNPLGIDRVLARDHPEVTRYWSVADGSVAVPPGAVRLIEGSTEWWRVRAAARVLVVVLCEKKHERRAPGIEADFCGVDVPDRYVFGYGMDYHEQGRNLPAIYAVDA